MFMSFFPPYYGSTEIDESGVSERNSRYVNYKTKTMSWELLHNSELQSQVIIFCRLVTMNDPFYIMTVIPSSDNIKTLFRAALKDNTGVFFLCWSIACLHYSLLFI